MKRIVILIFLYAMFPTGLIVAQECIENDGRRSLVNEDAEFLEVVPGVNWAHSDEVRNLVFAKNGETRYVVMHLYVQGNRSYQCTIRGNRGDETLDSVTMPFTEFTKVSNEWVQAHHSITFFSIEEDYPDTVFLDVFNNNERQGAVSCLETSLYGGFNTMANEINYLELSNITGQVVDVKIIAIDFDGKKVIDNKSVRIEASRRKDIDLHSLVGDRNYGLLIVNHNAPRGGLIANVAEYKSADDMSLAVRSRLTARDREL